MTEGKEMSPRRIYVLTLAIAVAAASAVCLYHGLRTGKDSVLGLTAQAEKYDALVTQSAAAQAAADFMQSYVVLVENDGTGLYHRYGCSRFAGKTFWAYSRKLAENSGYSPCPACVK